MIASLGCSSSPTRPKDGDFLDAAKTVARGRSTKVQNNVVKVWFVMPEGAATPPPLHLYVELQPLQRQDLRIRS